MFLSLIKFFVLYVDNYVVYDRLVNFLIVFFIKFLVIVC